MKLLKYGLSIMLTLLILSPLVFAEEFVHTIGGKVAPSLKNEELSSFVSNEVALWSDSATQQLNLNYPTLEVTSDDFQFNIESSVEQFLSKADVPWYAFWKRKQEVHQPLSVTLSERLLNALDQDPSIDMVQSSNELQLKASVLSEEPIQLVATSLSTADMERFSFVNIETGLPAAELQAVSELLNERVMQPQEEFSLLTTLEQVSTPITEDTANFVASTLYMTVLQTEFEIIERHSQGVVPRYTTLGLEAMVHEKLSRDFIFRNTFDTPITIKASHNAGIFLFEFYTLNPDSSARYEVGSREEIQPKRIERLVADLNYGAERKIEDGSSGWRVTTYRTISSTTGSFETQEVVARDYYPPTHTIYEVSSQTPPQESTTPTNGQTPGDVPITNPDGTVTTANPDGSTSTPGPGSGNGGSNTGGTGSSDGSTSGSGTEDSESDYDKGGNKID